MVKHMSKHLIQSKIFLAFLGVAMTLSACNGMSSNHPEPTPTATTYSSKTETTQSEERSPASQPSQTPTQDNSEAKSTATTATPSSQPETTSPKSQTFASQPSQKLTSKSSTTANSQVQRENYKGISLDKIADADALVGNDPESVALSTFGNIDSEGGSRDVTVDYPQSQRAIVTITQTGVADDSVGGIKHRVELQQTKSAQTDPQWKVVWAGSQVKCHPGRGHQDWSTELCF
jgi:cytoskeletal protein RodZ